MTATLTDGIKANKEINKNTQEFIDIYKKNIKREGSEELLNYLINETDFFEAPASSKYHLNIEGGLCLHSLNVYKNIRRENFKEGEYSEESIAIATLLHDLCKTNFYKKEKKFRKDESTNYEWEEYYTYSIDEQFPFGGHGDKSIYIIQKFMKLTDDEALAIRHHMGDFEKNSSIGNAYNRCKLAVYVHIADLESTYITENKN